MTFEGDVHSPNPDIPNPNPDITNPNPDIPNPNPDIPNTNPKEYTCKVHENLWICSQPKPGYSYGQFCC